MYLTTDKKQEIFKKHGKSEKDTGSSEGQIALFTFRIAHMTEHLKVNKKDFGTQRALIYLVGKRRALLDYLHVNVNYDLDETNRAGLQRYYELATAHGFIATARPLRFLPV